MYTPAQIWRHITPKIQLLIALSLATALAFSAGLATGIYGRAFYSPALNASRIVPAVAPAPQALPTIAGSGSAHDGSAYVEYLTARLAAPKPDVPAFGTGSVYDGGHYGDVSTQRVVEPAAQSVMDYLRAHGTLVAPPVNPNTPISDTGSAYNGR
jgi:hypothetical protein